MTEPADTLRILLFSDDRTVREEIRLTLGRKVASDLPPIEMVEVATGPALLRARRALRLVHELQLGLQGAAVVLDLLAEIDALRAGQRRP